MAGSVGSDDGDMGFQIAPMVDVVFVLMLFFMASVGSQVNEKEINMNLPAGSSGSGPTVTPIVIRISAEGLVTMNDQNYGQPQDKVLLQLSDFLKNHIETFGAKDPVILKPEPETRHERIIEVLNSATKAKVENLTFG